MGSIKDRNGMKLTEAEDIKRRWLEYTEEIYKKDLHDPENYDKPTTVQRIASRDKKAFLSDQCKEKEENRKSLEIASRKLEIPREHFTQRWAQ